MVRIGYIDDEEENVRTLKRKAKRLEEAVEIIDIQLHGEMQDTVTSIITSGVEAVLVDYNLKVSAAHVNYNGADIISRLNSVMLDFPAVILTAYETEAENELIDINIIYDKEKCFIEPKDLMRKMRRQIENYNKRIEQAQEEINELLSKGNLTGPEEKRMIELDEYLEKTVFKQGILPAELKTPSSLSQLSELVNKAEEILKEVKKR